jgi:hypothetical protein
MTYTKIIPFFLAPLLIASSAMSQSGAWGAVQALRSGTKIKVTLKNRPTFGHCFMDGASDDQLVCNSGRWPLSRRKVYLRDEIEAVYLTHHGPAIGLGVGAGTGAVIGASGAAGSSCCRAANALLGAGALGVVGWFSGTVADPFFHGRAVYRSPQDPYQAHNAPSLRNGRNTSQPLANVPSCLRDGVTFQCVDP